MKWEENVRKVVPYTPGEQPDQPDMIKLNTNECPYPPSPAVDAALKGIEAGRLRLYPDPEAADLTESLAAYYGVKKEQIFAGVGSDDVISMSFLTFFNSSKPILFPDITYSFYDVWAELYRIPFEKKPLDQNFHLRKEDYCQPNGGIIFPNPNAPTGLLEDLDTVEAILKANRDVIVIVDEAYIDFGGKSSLSLIDRYDNLLVVQTFSKSRAMAGIRIGFAIGNEKLIAYLNDVKYSFNSYTMNYPSIVLGKAALQDDVYFREIVNKIITTRERVKRELTALGFHFPDSQANFIFASHKKIPAREIFGALKQQNIYVRYFDKPETENYLRITVGTEEEMDAVIQFLRKWLPSNHQ